MLSEKQLREVAGTVSDGNIGHAEKLYIQDIILSTVSRETSGELVFKGGTALKKFYQLDRFSEDLDFTAEERFRVREFTEKAGRDLSNYGIKVVEKKEEDSRGGFRVRLGLEGPLYQGNRRSMCFIRLDFNKDSKVHEVTEKRYVPGFPDINAFTVPVMSEKEILAEKIRAVCTRETPRDLYDIYHLEKKGVKTGIDMVEKKLDYYGKDYSPGMVLKKAGNLEKGWETVETLVYTGLPDFRSAMESLKKVLDGLEQN